MTPMIKALREEATALARQPGHENLSSIYWTINPDAGTVRDIRNGDLIAYLHPSAIDHTLLKGSYFVPHAGGST